MSTASRLVQYAKLYQRTIWIALTLLTVSVFAELVGPFIAKHIIDTHILGIEKPWYQVEEAQGGVSYKGERFKRLDHLEEGEPHGREVRIVQVGRGFAYVDGPVHLEGKRAWRDGLLVVSSGEQEQSYEAVPLSRSELFAFFAPQIKPIVQLLAMFFAITVVSAVFHYGQRYMLQGAANRIVQKLREDVYAQVQRLPVSYFDNLPAGKVVSRITNDTETIRELYVTVLATFFTSGIYLTGIFIALFLLDARLAAICLLLIPIMVLWIVLYRRFATQYNRVIRARLSDINGMINESIQGMPVIQAFRREKETRQEFEEMNEDHFRYQNKMLNLNAITGHNLVNVLRNVAFVVLLWYFGGQSLGIGTVIEIGVLYAFVDYLNRLFQPVMNIVNQLANMETALVSAERVFELMDEPGVDVDRGTLPRYKGHVSFEQVWFAYKGQEYVLKDISFEAKPGETVALVGHTGSGKSSIMNVLFRFYDSQKGRIRIDGMDIQSLPKQQLRSHMGIVLQDPFLFSGTIASNVSLNDPAISRDAVEQALKAVGAEGLLRSLPKGLDEPVMEKGSTLSAGERQLISFARALAFDPAILILDEATASIDTETEAVIQEALEVLKRGRTTFVIAHRLSTIRNADQILVLDRGQIVERGTHDALMQRKGKYYQMYQLQQGAQTIAG
ncbi:ABC transporter ATP-binding protein [Xylanibacillus composti]|uniref:Multidrug ABC transporter permease n=1 Tax=Xylanibacillus composti TaxID=1572762 RepID=A0A8J4H3E6_9BACL|nr:ABC transporter ATP-binding protein [Xylanibacillus composti]MDT9723982.1 ABC transporter ATP-binding protein [Xylanibacillus composti]GIQ67863.1 multidrug ABC transporter permease [Xylanibacillus composti]